MSSSNTTQSASPAATSATAANAATIITGPTMAVLLQLSNLPVECTGFVATELHIFAFFPAELREDIWKIAIRDDEKIIEMKHPHCHAFDKGTFKGNVFDHRGLLGACSESRSIMLKESKVLKVGNNLSVRFNIATDTLYFGPSSYLSYWEVLEAFDRFDWSTSMQIYANNDVSMRLRNGVIRGLHPLLTTKDQSEKDGLKLIKKLAFDDSFLFRAKRSHIWKLVIDRFPAASSLTIVTGDAGEKGVRKDVYKKHTTTLPAPTGLGYNREQDELYNLLLPRVPDPIDAAKTYEVDCSRAVREATPLFGEVTFHHCPSHVQETIEHLVPFFQDRSRILHFAAFGTLPLQAEAADRGWSVMVAKRGGEYHGCSERMDDGFFEQGNFAEMEEDLGQGFVDASAFDANEDGELVLEDPEEEDMEFIVEIEKEGSEEFEGEGEDMQYEDGE